jgi:hypothetical protein
MGLTVIIQWETVSEADNLGFNLYREQARGPRTQLNDGLIHNQMPGSPLGAVYTFVDETAIPGNTYYYSLEDVDVHGMTTLHRPVIVEFRIRYWRLLPTRPRPIPNHRP